MVALFFTEFNIVYKTMWVRYALIILYKTGICPRTVPPSFCVQMGLKYMLLGKKKWKSLSKVGTSQVKLLLTKEVLDHHFEFR